MQATKGFMTVPEAAALLGISPWSVRQRVRAGLLNGHASGVDRRAILLRRAEVARLLRPVPRTRPTIQA